MGGQPASQHVFTNCGGAAATATAAAASAAAGCAACAKGCIGISDATEGRDQVSTEDMSENFRSTASVAVVPIDEFHTYFGLGVVSMSCNVQLRNTVADDCACSPNSCSAALTIT